MCRVCIIIGQSIESDKSVFYLPYDGYKYYYVVLHTHRLETFRSRLGHHVTCIAHDVDTTLVTTHCIAYQCREIRDIRFGYRLAPNWINTKLFR